MGRDKRPKIGQPPGGREVRATEMPMWNQLPICWHFRHLDIDGPFGWHTCDRATFINQIMERVRSFETMRWCDIERKLLHPIDVAKLSSVAQKRLMEIEHDDVPDLWGLRIGKQPRIWGIRDRLYFKVLWWDPDHQVYPVNITDN